MHKSDAWYAGWIAVPLLVVLILLGWHRWSTFPGFASAGAGDGLIGCLCMPNDVSQLLACIARSIRLLLSVRNGRMSGIRMAWACRLLARATNCMPAVLFISPQARLRLVGDVAVSCVAFHRMGIYIDLTFSHPLGVFVALGGPQATHVCHACPAGSVGRRGPCG